MSLDQRRAVLFAALGFLQLRRAPPEVAPLRRWLDTWPGVGAIMAGMLRQGFDVGLRSYLKRNIRGQGLGYPLMAEKVAHTLAEAWNLQSKRSSCVSSVEARHPARDARSAGR